MRTSIMGTAAGAVLAILAGCSDAMSAVETGQLATVASVVVSLGASTLAVGQTTQATAVAKDASGAVIDGRAVSWSSSNAGAATVSGAGLVSAAAAGGSSIIATIDGVQGSAPVTVTQPSSAAVASVTVTLNSASLTVGQTTQATAVAKDASGNVVTGRAVTWSTSAAGIATVNNGGGVTAVAVGSASISATVDGKTGSAALTVTAPPVASVSCSSAPAGTIFCDDFELDRSAKYFELSTANGALARTAGVGRNGSTGMKVHWGAGQVDAGSLKLAFGKTPDAYMKPADGTSTIYRDVYWRVYVKNQAGWTGDGANKLSRGIVFAKSDWSEAAIGHVWSGGPPNELKLELEPASGTDAAGNLQTSGYNDFNNLRALGTATGKTPIFDASHVGQWYCVETHMKLNDAGQSNGVFEMWINGALEAQKTGLNWLGSFGGYGINAVFLENWWNAGSPVAQDRYLDDFVVGTQRIGC